MSKNYYVILGIRPDSSLSDIKSAFRRLAKEFHPDYYGTSESPFPAIQEAYAVLSDPERRRNYDQSLEPTPTRTVNKGSCRFPQRVHEVHEKVEPLIPEEGAQAEPLRRRSTSILRPLRPELESLFDDTSEGAHPAGETARDRELIVTLSKEQARRGGRLRLRVPAQMRCLECGGSGSTGFYPCRRCFGRGLLQAEIPLLLNYPAHMADNHLARLRLNRYGINAPGIIVRFRIQNPASAS